MVKDIKTPTEIKKDEIQKKLDKLYKALQRKKWKTTKPTPAAHK